MTIAARAPLALAAILAGADAGILLVAVRDGALGAGASGGAAFRQIGVPRGGWIAPTSPIFLPGGRILFTAHAAKTAPDGGRAIDLSVSDLYLFDGGNVRRLTDGRAHVLFPASDTAGRRIVYTAKRYDLPRRSPRFLFLLDPCETAPRRIGPAQGDAYHPDLSPDGARVVYTRIGGDTPGIWLLDIASGGETRLVSDGDFARFSPQGDRILFLRDGRLHFLPRLDTAASHETLAIPVFGLDLRFPRWREEGILFVYARAGSGREGIGLYDPRDRSLRTFYEGPFRYSGADIAPHGVK